MYFHGIKYIIEVLLRFVCMGQVYNKPALMSSTLFNEEFLKDMYYL